MTGNPTTFERLREIIAYYSDARPSEILETDKIKTRFDDLWDFIEATLTAEEVFGVFMASDELVECETVSDLVRLIDSKLSEAKEEEGAI